MSDIQYSVITSDVIKSFDCTNFRFVSNHKVLRKRYLFCSMKMLPAVQKRLVSPSDFSALPAGQCFRKKNYLSFLDYAPN